MLQDASPLQKRQVLTYSFYLAKSTSWLPSSTAGTSGLFLRNCKTFAVADFAANPDTAGKLWKLGEKLVEEEFSI